jgi:trehalose 6-phosphate synthase/phosphatase
MPTRQDSGGNEKFGAGSSSSQTPQVPASRVDRLLLQRLRKSQSTTVLYGDPLLDQHENSLGIGAPPAKFTGADADAAAAVTAAAATATATVAGSSSSVMFPELGPGAESQRLLVVANRLPVSAYKDANGRWQLQVSAGGLVSALMGVGVFETKWIGWPGVYIEPGPERDELTAVLEKEGYAPVYLDQKTCDLHYNGFCNSVLWQLFHYVPLNIDSTLSETRTLAFQWAAHQLANRAFAEVTFKHYRKGDIVWVQDYHLMLLPAILKEKDPDMKVGFFLHTPFPSSEIYRTLPVREELLSSVLASDLIGFHTYDYARHFVSACTRILGLEGTPAGVEHNGSLTRVAAFPIGIDPDRFTHALELPDVKANIAQLLNRYAGRKVMLGVDRLDMIKGIPQKLLAFEKFLEEHPAWRDQVVLVQIAVPSRTDVPEYQRLRSMVHEVVGRINGKYGTLTHVPIYHLDRQLSFTELVALYAITDVALVTSLRDGMNLVSYEYVACQRDNAGALVLSEFAGAAQSLGAGAILVNPWNINDLAAAIEYALTMEDGERRERHRQNYMHVTVHTAQTWADTFISELNDTHVEAELRTKNIPPSLHLNDVIDSYKASRRKLLVLGYNATLTTAVEAPRAPKKHFDQIQALSKVNPTAYECLQALSKQPNTEIVIFSGSEKERLEEVFGDLDVWLAAENGTVCRPSSTSYRSANSTSSNINNKSNSNSVSSGNNIKSKAKKKWVTLLDAPVGEWIESVTLVFEYFCERTPRSFVEQRGTSLVWNYKYADVEFGRIQARDLLQHLLTGPISNAPVDIVRGGRSIEVRPVGVTKGTSMERILHYMAEEGGRPLSDIDFVLVAGHFLARDESVFTLFQGQKLVFTPAGGRGGGGIGGVMNGGGVLPQDVGDSALHSSTITTTTTDQQQQPELSLLDEYSSDPQLLDRLPPAMTPSRAIPMSTNGRSLSYPTVTSADTMGGSVGSLGGGGGGGSSSIGGLGELPMRLPPKYLYTCTVGRSMASAASYSLSGSSEVAQLLHGLAEADGAEVSPLQAPTSPTMADLSSSLGGLNLLV